MKTDLHTPNSHLTEAASTCASCYYCLFSRVYTFHCEISHCEIFAAVQLLSHVQLCNPMDRSTPGFPLSHYVSEFEQTHVHWVSDAIQPSHPLTPASPPNYLIFSWTSLYYNINTFSAHGSFTNTSPYTTQIQGLLIKVTVNFTHRAEGLSMDSYLIF